MIQARAAEGQHLTVFGPFDRPFLRRTLKGRSFRRIHEEIQTPILYTKLAQKPIRQIVVCLGGLGYASSAENWALNLAKILNASVTLLHVVEQVSFDYPIAQEINKNWEGILETETPQGRNLRQALHAAQDFGIPAVFKVRHGNIVHEILSELEESTCDLVVMGSPSVSTSLRHLYMPNVTAEVAESIDCPVLAVKYGQEWFFGA